MYQRKYSKLIASALFILFIGSCTTIKPQARIPGLDEVLEIDGIRIRVTEARILNSYSIHYIMVYPPEDNKFYSVTTMIDGYNDPSLALNWGKDNFKLIAGKDAGELTHAYWSIFGDDIQYKSGESFDYRYVYIFKVNEESDFTKYEFIVSGGHAIALDSILKETDFSKNVFSEKATTFDESTLDKYSNQVNGEFATVNGGSQNISSAYHTTVSGGHLNSASVAYGTVSGGRENLASNLYTTVGGGYGNHSSGRDSTIAGGSRNSAENYHATIGGGIRNTASASDTTIGGGAYNTASDIYATVGGGTQNIAGGSGAVVSGGAGNTASGTHATVSGGLGNHADGLYATITGGQGNTGYGNYSTVAGGALNQAGGNYSYAAGYRAIVQPEHNGAFLFSDSNDSDFQSMNENEYAVRATGGVRFITAVDVMGEPLSGVILTPGSGSWSSLSDYKSKENFQPVNQKEILEGLISIPITEWNYISQDASIRHIGPMAQDFFNSFNLGDKDNIINNVDADGIAYAGIQGLYQMVNDQENTIAQLEIKVLSLEKQINFFRYVNLFIIGITSTITMGYIKRMKNKSDE